MPLLYRGYERRRFRTKKSGGAVLLLHTYTGADNAATVGNADTGQAPTVLQLGANAVWGRTGGRAYLATAGTDYSFLVFETGAANGTLRTLVYTQEQSTGLCFRVADKDNLFMLEMVSVGANPADFTLYRRQAGAWNTIASVTGVARTDGDPLSVVLNGASIVVKLAGVTIITVSDSFNSGVTKHGLAHKSTLSTTRYDDLSFTS